MHIPFNQPYFTGNEVAYIREAQRRRHLSANGYFSSKCHGWLRDWTGGRAAFLTPSCTAALEMAAILVDFSPGDEVIMPSFTFVTCASAFVLRGVTPVFVDINPETFNIDENIIRQAITKKTKALLAVHYGGASCDMLALRSIADEHNLILIEDAAHSLLAYDNRGHPIGSSGDLTVFSFHETKNISSGEGGALVIHNESFIEKGQVVWEKGTNRNAFLNGLVDKYRWMELGSSFGASEITAATLWAQLQTAKWITAERLKIWKLYHDNLEEQEHCKQIRRPRIPTDIRHNAHLYPILLPSEHLRDTVLEDLNKRGVEAVTHYVPLHSSPAGVRYGRKSGSLDVTENVSSRLIRLPIWIGLLDYQDDLIKVLNASIENNVINR